VIIASLPKPFGQNLSEPIAILSNSAPTYLSSQPLFCHAPPFKLRKDFSYNQLHALCRHKKASVL